MIDVKAVFDDVFGEPKHCSRCKKKPCTTFTADGIPMCEACLEEVCSACQSEDAEINGMCSNCEYEAKQDAKAEPYKGDL